MHTWKSFASSLLIVLLLVAGCTTALPPVTPSNTATPTATPTYTATPTVVRQLMATQVPAADNEVLQEEVQVVAEAAAPLGMGGGTVPCCSSGGTSNVNDAPYDLTFF